MEMEGVRCTRAGGVLDGERQLDGRVTREHVDGAAWHELGRSLGTAHDLEEHWHRRRRIRDVVDEERRTVLRTAYQHMEDCQRLGTTHERHRNVDRKVDAANFGRAGRGEVVEGYKVRLVQRQHTRALVRGRLDLRRAVVAQDG